MKNKILTLLSFLLFSSFLFAQRNASYDQPSGFASLDEAGQMAQQIVKASGQSANFAIMEADVPNALAVFQGGKRYILYNPDFVNKLTRATGTKWAAVSVLAHEIGHHLYKSETKSRRGLATELEADEFSGYVLGKMGATLNEAEAAMKLLATTRATATHPGRDDRLESISEGWMRAGGMETGVAQIRKREEPVVVFPKPTNTLSTSSIAATIQMDNSPGTTYYVTKKLNIVKADNDQVELVGRVARSNSASYPYIIYDDGGEKLYVNRYGVIVNEEGERIGKMKAYL